MSVTQPSRQTDTNALGGIRNVNPSKQLTALSRSATGIVNSAGVLIKHLVMFLYQNHVANSAGVLIKHLVIFLYQNHVVNWHYICEAEALCWFLSYVLQALFSDVTP